MSDKPGQHDFALLKRMVLADGSLLRCKQVGRPTLDTLFDDVMRDGTSLLKVSRLSNASAFLNPSNRCECASMSLRIHVLTQDLGFQVK